MVESNPCRSHNWCHPGPPYKRSVMHFRCCDAFMPHHADWNEKEGKYGDGCTCRRCGATRGRPGRTSGGFFGKILGGFTGEISITKRGWPGYVKIGALSAVLTTEYEEDCYKKLLRPGSFTAIAKTTANIKWLPAELLMLNVSTWCRRSEGHRRPFLLSFVHIYLY